MEKFGFAQLNLQNIHDASEHFATHDNFMSVKPGEGGAFDYSKRICLIGNSFVSVSLSSSGWGYETSNEVDGFVITIPYAGSLQWQSPAGAHRVEPGAVALVDQREVFVADYACGVRYTTVYIANVDIFRYLTLLLGTPPKTRVYFYKNKGGAWQIRFIEQLVATLLELAAHAPQSITRVACSLKETLIGFLLFNFSNNYSRVLAQDDPADTPSPTPHAINKAAEYMAASLDPHLTVCEVATYAGLSVRSLQTGFKRFKNTTPIGYLRGERLQRAAQMLGSRDNPSSPKEVALQCGFSNYQVFCKYYLQRFNEHPATTRLKAGRAIRSPDHGRTD